MTPWEIGGLTLFIVVLIFGISSIPFGLPGTVIILIDATLYGFFTGFEKLGFKTLLLLLALSALAEIADFVVGMAVAVKSGVSRRGLWAFFIGGSIGALLMAPYLLGLGIILGSFLGGFAAILTLELIDRNRLKPSLRAAWGAILGRVAGIGVKGFLALIMIIITLTSIYS
ncbi:MAG: DUF456 domain-containing protein [Deltaproteobacteria bacterium]|nr:DUF456 domain-containing protein [Deltaproteobacteria bacterium]